MTKELIYEVWAPSGALWSPWVKPVLFAAMQVDKLGSATQVNNWDATWAPRVDEGVALVLDLPGPESVRAGLALAERGYRPVPLYNAIPAPVEVGMTEQTGVSVVELSEIVAGLYHGTGALQRLDLPPDAPPAFLLDWNRRRVGTVPQPEQFDNRSVSFTTDFPSANFLIAHGILRAVLVHPNRNDSTGMTSWPAVRVPQIDLAHTLRRWQDAGVVLELRFGDDLATATPLNVPKPPWFGWFFQRALIAMGLSRSPMGGFGAWLPESAAG